LEAQLKRHILGILRLAILPASPDSRVAQEGTQGNISAKRRHSLHQGWSPNLTAP